MKFVFAVPLIFVLACAASTPDSAVGGAAASSVADELRAAGLRVEEAGEIEQPFFTRRARVLRVNDDDLQLYEFATAAAAEAAAREVDPSGGSIGTVSMSWMAPPHFFRRGSLIAIYIGRDAETLAVLQRLLGPQFAGR